KHISLAEAASVLVKVHEGATKPLKDLGINVKENATLLADADKATKAHTAAVDQESKANQALADLEARLHGVKQLSVSQQQQLEKAHQAVATAQQKVTATTHEQEKAQAAANEVTKNAEELFNQSIDKYKG